MESAHAQTRTRRRPSWRPPSRSPAAAAVRAQASRASRAVADRPERASPANITVLTNRTDLVSDGTLKKYAAEFNKIYPKVKVKFEGITDYEGEVKTRMNTENYGDVLLIPQLDRHRPTTRSSSPRWATPADMSEEVQLHRQRHASATQVYGLADFGNANGFVYNKAVWTQAGITDLADHARRSSSPTCRRSRPRPSAIPYYTNYKDGWPLSAWSAALGSATCDTAANDKLATDQTRGRRARTSTSIDTPALQHRARQADRARPDHDQLGGLEGPARAPARSPRCGSARGRSCRCRTRPRRPARTRPTSATCRSRRRWTASSARSSRPDYQSRDQHPLQEQGGRPGLARLVHRQVRHSPGRPGRSPRSRARRCRRRCADFTDAGVTVHRRCTQAKAGAGQQDRQRVRGRLRHSPTTASTSSTSPAARRSGEPRPASSPT